ncbi:protein NONRESPONDING TO OXYLIPINS 2, mitochondrial isoform X3 [Ricinus communis]|uniref:protein NONRESPONDING TO OXYLIPINS 2, mitochondrial isoform X3 n=1 Tax=Ricinus communis TaxID=3988 RepID=UPI00201A9038|nr:protein NONRESPONDING TO OXYLIPINS 2, mitochondrial isoform X3 [Ricinus communis]
MASSCRRFISKSSLSSIKSAIRSNAPKSPSPSPSSPSSLPSASLPRRFSFSSRAPCELGCVQSLLPLHSAVAVARMTSCLSTTSRSCRALSQELGLSVPR